jgi:class 3 adenylate cyclase/tetratricopeptide (TPR) repeat protein
MRCPGCAHDNPEGQKFCGACGARLTTGCPACGAANPPGQKFCGGCGTRLPEAPVSPQFAQPATYTPRHLAEKILTSRSALEGERKQVTVLFVDVSGFTSLSERLDPEDTHAIMTRAFELMLAEVHRYEGTVNQFLGDGIMALFGAPIAHEDHARRAIHAALGIRQALGGYQDELRRDRGIGFEVRQGLNTGLVVVGSIGSDLRMDYTAVGDTTNVAARLQQVADPGRIVISAATRRLAEGYFHTRPLGDRALKGKAQPVPAFEVISARDARTRLDVEAERGLTRFTGREGELRLLAECFAKVRAGHGQMVFLVGEPGIGKSRLLHEFRRRLGEDATWLEGHAISFGRNIAFHPLLDLLKRNFRIQEGDSEATIAGKIEHGLLRLGEDLRPSLPYLRYLLAIDPGDPAVLTMDPKRRRAEVFGAVRRLMLRAAEVRPQVVVCEDLHWMDRATEEYLLFAADSIPTSRVLCILTYRPGYAQPFGEHTYHTRIALDALSPEESRRMVGAMLAVDGLPDELARLIAGKAEGNPFFVEEVVKALQEVGAIRRAGDRYVLARRLDEILVPDTIQDVISARIDRLAEAPKKTLQLASVIGREFTRRLLERIAEIRDRTEEFLRDLKSLELIYEKSAHPELAYMFKHALTHEVAYGSLLVQRRKELHRLIGLAIEELYADRLAEQYEVLAHHFSKAEDWPRALEYLVKAGDKAAQAFAGREAVGLYEQALGLLADDPAPRAEVLQKLAWVMWLQGDGDASLGYAQPALELYERLGDRRKLLDIHMFLTGLYIGGHWDGAKEDKALAHLEVAAALSEDDPDSVQKGLVYQRTGHLYLHRGQPAVALIWTRKAVDLYTRLNVSMGTALGTALTYTGKIDEGVAYAERNWAPVSKSANPLVISIFGHELSLTLALARDVCRAREWGERILRETEGKGILEQLLRRPLALIYELAGEPTKADEMCRAVEMIESRTLMGCNYEDGGGLGFHYLRRGDWDRAEDYLARTIQAQQDRNNLAAVGSCSLFLGMLELERGNTASAEALLMESLETCRRGGNVLFELWVLPALAGLCLKMGRPVAAAEYVTRAFNLMTAGQNWYGLPAPVHTAHGVLATARRDWTSAEGAFEQAVAINREFLLPWDEAKALHEWGLMHLARGAAGDRDSARQKLDQALAIFERVEARKDVDKTRIARDCSQRVS